MYYKLGENNQPIECTVEEFKVRQIAGDTINGVRVSTIFLGIDHGSLFFGGSPVLFETMVFGDHELDQECIRYTSWVEAMEGHKEMCKKVIEKL